MLGLKRLIFTKDTLDPMYCFLSPKYLTRLGWSITFKLNVYKTCNVARLQSSSRSSLLIIVFAEFKLLKMQARQLSIIHGELKGFLYSSFDVVSMKKYNVLIWYRVTILIRLYSVKRNIYVWIYRLFLAGLNLDIT